MRTGVSIKVSAHGLELSDWAEDAEEQRQEATVIYQD